MAISEVANELLQKRKGYRNDDLSSGVYKITEIIEFETKELENEDIMDTCKRLYQSSDPLKVIKDVFHHTDVYGLWLARKEDVLQYYAEDEETWISEYRIPNNAIIISDIEEEGILFVIEEHPNNLLIDKELVKRTKSFRNQ